MAAPPPAKRQRKLVVLPSSSDNEETKTRPSESVETSARSATVSSKKVNPTRARQKQQQQQPKKAVVSPNKKKTRKSGPPSRSLHNFFQPATDEQRWSFHKSEVQQPKGSCSSSSFLDELEEDRIEDDYDDNDLSDVFEEILGGGGGGGGGGSEKGKAGEGRLLSGLKMPPTRASSKRFILDGRGHHNMITTKDVAAEEKMRRRNPWSEQYPPADVAELAVHKRKVDDVQNWLVAALSGRSRNKLLVLHGPAGCGKTSTISLLSSVLNFDIVEWRSPFGGDTGNGQYASLSAQFEDFLSQLNGFGGLDLTESTTTASNVAKQTSQRRVILIEEFPASLSRGSVALSSFQASLRRYLASSSSSSRNIFGNRHSMADSTPPIVIIISETMLGTSGAMSENLTAHRLLGPEVYANPATTTIEFNPIAPTFMLKALQLVLKKEARHSMRQRIPGIGVLKRFSELGDIRSAISSLEFLCLRDDKSVDWGGRVAARVKNRTAEIPLTAMEKESLELITQRESSLGLFHAVGKVVYNKRDDGADQREDNNNNDEVHVMPPPHLQHLDRPRVSQVSVEDLMDKTGTDVHTFTAALHENYPPSCDGAMFAATLEGCIENLSDSDILGSEARSSLFNSRSGVGTARGRFLGYGASIDRLRQDEISFHVAVRGMLFSLPYPVRRKAVQSSSSTRSSSSSTGRVGGAFKMYFPTSQRLWKDIEEVEGLVGLWERQLLSDPCGIRDQKLSASGRDLGVASWKTNASTSNKENGKQHLNVMSSVMPREDMLLHYLPYLSKIMGSNSSNIVRGLDRITQFNGIDALKGAEDDDDDDDVLAEAESVNDWSTDPVVQPAGGPGRAGFQKVTPENEAVVEAAEEGLFLSDDDIED